MSKKILIIDDSPTIFGIIEQIILSEPEFKNQIDILRAVDGFDGLIKVASENPDLIFMDYDMPYLNGFQTTSLIKNNPDFIETPIIFFSGKYSVFDKVYGQMLGAEEYLSKDSLKKDSLKDIIKKYIFHYD